MAHLDLLKKTVKGSSCSRNFTLVSSISLLRWVSPVAALWWSVAWSTEATAVLSAKSAAVAAAKLSTAEVATFKL